MFLTGLEDGVSVRRDRVVGFYVRVVPDRGFKVVVCFRGVSDTLGENALVDELFESEAEARGVIGRLVSAFDERRESFDVSEFVGVPSEPDLEDEERVQFLESLTVAQLKAVVNHLGVEGSPRRKKGDLIRLLDGVATGDITVAYTKAVGV